MPSPSAIAFYDSFPAEVAAPPPCFLGASARTFGRCWRCPPCFLVEAWSRWPGRRGCDERRSRGREGSRAGAMVSAPFRRPGRLGPDLSLSARPRRRGARVSLGDGGLGAGPRRGTLCRTQSRGLAPLEPVSVLPRPWSAAPGARRLVEACDCTCLSSNTSSQPSLPLLCPSPWLLLARLFSVLKPVCASLVPWSREAGRCRRSHEKRLLAKPAFNVEVCYQKRAGTPRK